MSDDAHSELEAPDSIQGSERADEVLRVWIADGSLHVTFAPGTFETNVAEWGRLLSDVARHVAHAVTLDGQMSYERALKAVHDAYIAGASDQPEITGRIRGRASH